MVPTENGTGASTATAASQGAQGGAVDAGAGAGATASAATAAEESKEAGSIAFSDGDEEIIGGLTVAQSEMDGVAQEELEYLSRRSKRKAVQPVQVAS
jgi:hypothetical protein